MAGGRPMPKRGQNSGVVDTSRPSGARSTATTQILWTTGSALRPRPRRLQLRAAALNSEHLLDSELMVAIWSGLEHGEQVRSACRAPALGS
jgi:hypothetical protein